MVTEEITNETDCTIETKKRQHKPRPRDPSVLDAARQGAQAPHPLRLLHRAARALPAQRRRARREPWLGTLHTLLSPTILLTPSPMLFYHFSPEVLPTPPPFPLHPSSSFIILLNSDWNPHRIASSHRILYSIHPKTAGPAQPQPQSNPYRAFVIQP